MAAPRVEIPEVVLASTGAPVSGASVQVNLRGAGAATVYAAETGGTTSANPILTDANGRIEGWLEEGSYDLVVSGTGLTTYTQPFEAVRGSNSPGKIVTTAGDIIYATSANNIARLGIGTSGQVLTVASGVPSWSGGNGISIYDRVTTPVSNLNSAVETTMYSKSIAANDLSTNKTLRLTLDGDHIANSVGNAKNLTIRVKFGGTTMYAETVNLSTDSATRSPFSLVFRLSNQGATNSQVVVGEYNLSTGGGGTGPTTGEGATTTTNSIRKLFGTAAVDTTSAQTLAVTMQWDLNNSTREVKVYSAILELI